MKQKAVVIIGGGFLQVPMIKEAKALGFATIVTDRNPHCPGARIADITLAIDTYDVQKHRQVFSSLFLPDTYGYDVCGVATCGADVAPTVAAVAEELGLPGIPYDVAVRTHNKATVRAVLSKSPVTLHQPAYTIYRQSTTEEIVRDIHDGFFRHGRDKVVVKPTQQAASRGVSIVGPNDNISAAVEYAMEYGQEILVESCMTGTEHSVELILRDGELLYQNIVDRIFSYVGGVPMELGHINPSRLYLENSDLVARIIEIVQDAAQVLGVFWGPFKADICVTPKGHVYIFECTARLSGGWDCQATTPYSTGRNPIRTVLMLACDLPMDKDKPWLPTTTGGFAACAAGFPKPGAIRSLPARADFTTDMVNIMEYHIICREGDVIPEYKHCAQRQAFFIAKARTYHLAWKYAYEAATQWAGMVITDEANRSQERTMVQE